jgi:RNA polymerase sigma-70 factor, ECF subfamily
MIPRRISGSHSVLIYRVRGHGTKIAHDHIKIGDRDMSPEEERDFMRRIVNGDKTAFGTIMGEHMTDIYRFAYSIVGDASRAEDISQEAFIRLWTKAASWNSSGGVKSWLFGITHRLCVDEIRKRKSHVPLDNIAFVFPDAQKDPLQSFTDSQSTSIVKKALFSLPERQRTALVLVHCSGFTNGEAANLMGVSVDAIESLLARGRQKLKSLLSDSRNSLLGG